MKFLQKLGKALMLPVAVLPICGILMGIGYMLCPEAIQGGDIQGAADMIGLFLVKAGGALIDNMAILFVIGVGVGMADDNDGTAALAALASWLMMTNLLSTGVVTTLMPVIAENETKVLAFSKIANPFIGILAGIAVPRFLDATASARGAKIVADMRTIQSAEMIYYAKNAKYPTAQNDFADLVQGNWPGVPTGKFIIAQVLKKGGGTTEGVAGDGAAYTYTAGADGASGTITLTGATNLTGVSGSSYTLTVLLGGDQQVTTPES